MRDLTSRERGSQPGNAAKEGSTGRCANVVPTKLFGAALAATFSLRTWGHGGKCTLVSPGLGAINEVKQVDGQESYDADGSHEEHGP
jgi:hypothetical protein